ncbi:MAG: xanthine dehydrogenase family protein subunit M, partial [Gemmatimonadota bacterium]
ARIGMTGLGPMVMRLSAVEAALLGKPATAATAAAAAAHAADAISFDDDSRMSAAYKANLARVHAGRAISRALAASAA